MHMRIDDALSASWVCFISVHTLDFNLHARIANEQESACSVPVCVLSTEYLCAVLITSAVVGGALVEIESA
jgi:hypothetical protein